MLVDVVGGWLQVLQAVADWLAPASSSSSSSPILLVHGIFGSGGWEEKHHKEGSLLSPPRSTD